MEKVLITGATGLLGSSLAPYLTQRAYAVVTNARATQADWMFDLSNRSMSYQVLNEIRPDVIINLVGLTNVQLCEEQPHAAYLGNTRAVESLTHWIATTHANCHLIQISTDHVYDGNGPHTEDEVILRNTYAFSKYAGELAAARVPSTILRTNFVGRSRATHRVSFADWLYHSLRDAKPIQVVSDVYFSPLSISTLVEMIALSVERRPLGVYNLGSQNGMSKADFAYAFAACLGLPTTTMRRIEASQAEFLKVYRPKDMRMDSRKWESLLQINLPHLADVIHGIAGEYENAT
jgi:dTDP-4-dehydrorhamnose reductase